MAAASWLWWIVPFHIRLGKVFKWPQYKMRLWTNILYSQLSLSLFPKAKKVLYVFAPRTALKDSVAPATSGPRFANLSLRKVRCVQSTTKKAPMVWNSSSGATAETDCPVDCKKTTLLATLQDYILARDISRVGFLRILMDSEGLSLQKNLKRLTLFFSEFTLKYSGIFLSLQMEYKACFFQKLFFKWLIAVNYCVCKFLGVALNCTLYGILIFPKVLHDVYSDMRYTHWFYYIERKHCLVASLIKSFKYALSGDLMFN